MKTNVEIINFIKGQMKEIINLGAIGSEEWKAYRGIVNANLSEKEQEAFYDELSEYKYQLMKRK